MEFTKSDPIVAPAPKMAAFPSLAPILPTHSPCCIHQYQPSIETTHFTYLGMTGISRMLWVLGRLGNLRHRRLIAIIGRVARIDILAWHSASLLPWLSEP